jgi:hypothetical protein
MKKLIFVVLLLALSVPLFAQTYKAQDEAAWFRLSAKDYWGLKRDGRTSATWDSLIGTASFWTAPFRSWDYQSAIIHIIKDSVRFEVEYWAGVDTARATMVFGRVLEWDKGAALDSTYLASTGYWNCNITESAIPVHPWARLKITPTVYGGRVKADTGLFTVFITGRK